MPDVHDLGGASGFGAIPGIEGDFEYDERWEWTLMAVLRLGVKKGWYRTDAYRHAVERLPNEFYLHNAYFDRMLSGVTRAHIEAGIVTEDEIKAHLEDHVTIPAVKAMGPGHSGPAPTQTVRLQPGDSVRVRSPLPDGHVRAPAYVRGHIGTILHCGRHALAFPGEAGHRMDATSEFTYRVEFDRRSLWSDALDDGAVVVDLSESYLELAELQTQRRV
ncbi:nitrile hydratase subunit beta [Variovorax sp. J22P168]|uniref:SH3-like domain-containing protein n=1 Tax=Variovorax jilinensis TaxID=3053513 RepID=UPI0025785DE1|nr:SH3-like domain-containing protein [Variovorax sp. J22P168]MDM0015077.1 nitrile hydratase subunit beta [Variovorax sp. J22P168]